MRNRYIKLVNLIPATIWYKCDAGPNPNDQVMQRAADHMP